MAKNDQYKETFRPESDSALDKEIDAALGGMSIEDIYAAEEKSTKKPQSQERGMRKGRIISIGKDDVVVDFGGKTQGLAKLEQFDEEPKVGDMVEFAVERFDPREGLLILTRKGAAATDVKWETLEIGQVVEGVVTGVNKGGLELQVKGMRAFMPAGQIELYHVPDISQFLNQKLTCEVMQADREDRNLVLSRRNLLEKQREEMKAKLMGELAEGQVRRGVVRNVMDFGAFVDLGGVDGMVHISEMTYRRGRSAAEFVKTGDVVDVKVVKIDRETGRIGLSLKQARGQDPWADANTKYSTGTTITGRVTRLEQFGAFIEVEEGIEGLLPVSEIGWQRIKHPKDVLKEGDTLKLVVLSIDPAARRMSFSLKQAGPDPWSTVKDRFAIDMIIKGTVTRVADFGAFVEIEPGLEGLVHVSELSNQHIRTPADVVKTGQEVQVAVLDVDKDARRLALSIKRVHELVLPEPAPGSVPAEPAKKKKRPELRGGLDFEYKKNK